MIRRAEERGEIAPGDTLIEATSGNTGIALAMAAAIKGYRMILVMPENMSTERRALMRSYGAEIVLTPAAGSMEAAIDLSREMEARGEGRILDQFSNPDNPRAHYEGTGPEIWRDTGGTVTHFVSSMGTTGTIMGTGRYLKEQNPQVQIVGVQPTEGSKIPGIRRWPEAYLPRIYDPAGVDRIIDVSQAQARGRLLRHLLRRRGGGRTRPLRGAARWGDRRHRLRPRRPLSLHGGLSRLNGEEAQAAAERARRGPDRFADPRGTRGRAGRRQDGLRRRGAGG
jgi:cysteine synthase B